MSETCSRNIANPTVAFRYLFLLKSDLARWVASKFPFCKLVKASREINSLGKTYFPASTGRRLCCDFFMSVLSLVAFTALTLALELYVT